MNPIERALGACVFAAALSTMAPPARAETVSAAEPLDLEWNAPADCPGRDTVIEEIRRALGDVAPPPATARLVSRVYVARSEDGRWHVRIVTLGESGGERAFDSASCSALTRATALVLAIRLKPARSASKDLHAGPARASLPAPVTPPPPPPTPPAPLSMPIPVRIAGIVVAAGAVTEAIAPTAVPTPERASPERPPFRLPGSLIVGVSAIVSAGDLPAANPGAELDLAYVVGHMRIELHGETGLVQQVSTTALHAASPASVSFRAAGGGLRACYGPSIGAFDLYGCADGEVDAEWASGHDFPTPLATAAGAWVTLAALMEARFRLTTRLALRATVEALVPLQRPTFITETAGGATENVVHDPSAIWGRAGFGLEAKFH